MDIFHEEVCARAPRQGVALIFYWLSWVLTVALALLLALQILALMSAFNVLDLLIAVGCLGVIAFSFYYRQLGTVDYEYSLTNGDLAFARIINNQKRKDDLSVPLIKVSAAGIKGHQKYNDLEKMPDLRRHNFYLHTEAPHYFICFRDGDGKSHMVVYEPSPEMEKLVRECVPKGQYYA